jgi:hypothetical protein
VTNVPNSKIFFVTKISGTQRHGKRVSGHQWSQAVQKQINPSGEVKIYVKKVI